LVGVWVRAISRATCRCLAAATTTATTTATVRPLVFRLGEVVGSHDLLVRRYRRIDAHAHQVFVAKAADLGVTRGSALRHLLVHARPDLSRRPTGVLLLDIIVDLIAPGGETSRCRSFSAAALPVVLRVLPIELLPDATIWYRRARWLTHR
jgi:hypothetical protein